MLANPKVGAIIHAGQPSVTVSGVGDLVFGKAVPAGRMIQVRRPPHTTWTTARHDGPDHFSLCALQTVYDTAFADKVQLAVGETVILLTPPVYPC